MSEHDFVLRYYRRHMRKKKHYNRAGKDTPWCIVCVYQHDTFYQILIKLGIRVSFCNYFNTGEQQQVVVKPLLNYGKCQSIFRSSGQILEDFHQNCCEYQVFILFIWLPERKKKYKLENGTFSNSLLIRFYQEFDFLRFGNWIKNRILKFIRLAKNLNLKINFTLFINV